MANIRKFQSSLALSVLVGADKNGRDVFKTQTFSKINTEADPEAVAEVGFNASKLFPDSRIIRIDKSAITKN
ncbi:DUF1659 domain-containing protein [Clostridium novyi]|uniref:DUF1659 domain-containing protein n=1 Tax=Clostridium novyi TaxID=1542 RepID=UPI0004D3662B|nr:DUF1659 domain-containing protein [Clostridium novyi]KEH95240.1 hypothetical protein Z964_09210 [Clostridium novyi A str. GD211209]